MKYTNDWFSSNIPKFQEILAHLKGKPNLNFLEIGCYEGMATNWFLDNVLTDESSKIFCMDLFDDYNQFVVNNKDGYYQYFSEQFKNVELNNYFENFAYNIEHKKNQVKILKGDTSKLLYDPEFRKNKFDFIYLDGAHHSSQVLEDTVCVWRLLKVGGLITFDDYGWHWRFDQSHTGTPSTAIDSFISCYARELEVVEKSNQVTLRKTLGE